MSERVYILALWLRLWHWTNAALILCLTASGLSLHYSAPAAALVDFSVARGVHNFCGIGLCVAYSVFFIGNIISGNWYHFIPNPNGFIERAINQVRYYAYGIFVGAPHPYPPTPERNFNPMQQVAYFLLMYFVLPALLLTGLVFMYPEVAPDKIWGVDGLLPFAVAHCAFAFVVVCFLALHLYLATTGDTLLAMIKMMITGWHEHEEHH